MKDERRGNRSGLSVLVYLCVSVVSCPSCQTGSVGVALAPGTWMWTDEVLLLMAVTEGKLFRESDLQRQLMQELISKKIKNRNEGIISPLFLTVFLQGSRCIL